jgi:hypothetical protein
MTRGTRRWLFYGLLALFLIAGASVVLYAEGVRLDLATGKISKIGAIFVRSYPDDAAIYLNGKSIDNQSAFLNRGTLISDLFPKTYALKLTASGYLDWHENIGVAPSLVTQLKYAVLIPQHDTATASGTVQQFSIAAGRLAALNASGTIIFQGQSIGKGTIQGETLDGSAVIFKNPNGNEYLYDGGANTLTNLSSILANNTINVSGITNISIDPYDGSRIIAAGPKKIWSFDINQSIATSIERISGSATINPALAIGSQLIAWSEESAQGTSTVLIYDQYAQAINGSTTFATQNKKLTWINGNTLGIVQADGSFYLYDTDTQTLEKMADDVTDFSASADGTMIATLEHKSVEIFSLSDPSEYYRFNLPAIGDVQRLLWYKDDNHLFVAYPDHVAFLDFSDSGLNNFTTIANGTSSSYDPTTNSLYLINTSGTLARFDFPQ